jgi:hypothetical protein
LRTVWTWSIAGLVLAFAIIFLVAFVDRPVALTSYDFFAHLLVLRSFANAPSFYLLGLMALVPVMALRYFAGFSNRTDRVLIQCAVSLALTRLCLAPLKILFGRTWPVFPHPSLIKDGVFGFNFFHHGLAYASFPSGHAAAVCSIIGVVWVTHPRYRIYYVSIVMLFSLGLIVGDFHFVSDVLAGDFLGAIVAATVLRIFGTAYNSTPQCRDHSAETPMRPFHYIWRFLRARGWPDSAR